MRQFTCPKAVTHPSTNRARCRATARPTRYRYTKPPHTCEYVKDARQRCEALTTWRDRWVLALRERATVACEAVTKTPAVTAARRRRSIPKPAPYGVVWPPTRPPPSPFRCSFDEFKSDFRPGKFRTKTHTRASNLPRNVNNNKLRPLFTPGHSRQSRSQVQFSFPRTQPNPNDCSLYLTIKFVAPMSLARRLIGEYASSIRLHLHTRRRRERTACYKTAARP